MNEGAYSHFSTIYESSLAYLKSYFQANIEQANQIVITSIGGLGGQRRYGRLLKYWQAFSQDIFPLGNMMIREVFGCKKTSP